MSLKFRNDFFAIFKLSSGNKTIECDVPWVLEAHAAMLSHFFMYQIFSKMITFWAKFGIFWCQKLQQTYWELFGEIPKNLEIFSPKTRASYLSNTFYHAAMRQKLAVLTQIP